MTLRFPDEKGSYNVERLRLVSKNPVINKVSPTKDGITFWNLSLLLGNINWNVTIFLKENLWR